MPKPLPPGERKSESAAMRSDRSVTLTTAVTTLRVLSILRFRCQETNALVGFVTGRKVRGKARFGSVPLGIDDPDKPGQAVVDQSLAIAVQVFAVGSARAKRFSLSLFEEGQAGTKQEPNAQN